MKRRLDADLITAASAVLIGVCALGVSLYEASLMREQQRMAVWPYVEVGPSVNVAAFRLRIYNQGIGPARVQDATVTLRGEPVRTWSDLMEALLDTVPPYAYDMLNRRVLPAKEARVAFGIVDSALADSVARAFVSGDVRVSICYCSVYDECWRTEAARPGVVGLSEPVGACRPDSSRSFLQ